ncbi:MAG: RdgB/HAM1 family non-canonical purine NTP pyrophosphatase [Clostridia bacterium]|nr:RdgB/HAM1 family non-canonical purine NTP pyrophosphatase [Clostridia bacterium]
MEIVIATNNPNKVREIKRIYEMLCSEKRAFTKNTEFFTLKEKNLVCRVEENGSTFAENSLIKAKAAAEKTSLAVLADDSGICVDALGGAPGIFSNRFARENDDAANRKKLLDMLREKGLTDARDRKAHFECAMTLILPTGVFSASGTSDGYILDGESGGHGFGYDCIFYSDELEKSWGEATDDEKNKVSHRARALKNVLETAGLL